MMSSRWCVLAVSVSLLGACGDKAAPGASSTGGTGAGVGAGAAGTGTSQNGAGTMAASAGNGGAAGVVATLPDGGIGPVPMADAGSTVNDPCDYSMENVDLTADLVIAAGETLHVCPGVTFKAATGVKIQVLGQLNVDGTTQAPVSFLGSATQPRSWHGIVIESGGHMKLVHAKIGGAIYGMYAMPGSEFSVDASELGTSFKAAIVQSDGAFTNTKFVATTPPTIAITDAVTVDDPNGTVTIIDASPSFSNCKFDGSSAFTDLVRVGGESSATFDHVHLHAAHCGFHTSGGTNTSIRITNSIIEDLPYGIMAYATKPIVEDSIFRNNTSDVGICTGATNANTPVLKNNFYANGSATVDASCFMIGTADASPAATANPSAGPSGL